LVKENKSIDRRSGDDKNDDKNDNKSGNKVINTIQVTRIKIAKQ
jgi:hypothetical protein